MSVSVARCPKCAAECPISEGLVGQTFRCLTPGCGHRFDATCPEPVSRPASPASTEVSQGAAFAGAAPVQPRLRADDAVPVNWEVGDVILDLYEVRPLTAEHPYLEGGMGRVNRVWHRGWQMDLAVKSVNPQYLQRPGAVEHFQREAEVWVNKLNLHPNLVFCYYVRLLGGLPRIFVEYVDGGDLASWIESGKLYEGGPEAALERILDVAIQAAWGLHAIYVQGLVHQDVKPRNVLMTREGIAKVTDFGIARARAAAEAGESAAGLRPDVTALAGTRSYQSPEQAAGERLTLATDVWSWAVSVLDFFVGRVERGFGPAALMALEQYVAQDGQDPRCPRMPPRVVELLRRCFRSRPEDRPRSMLEIANELRDIYETTSGRPYPRVWTEPAEALADSLNNRALSLYDSLDRRQEAEQKWQEALRVDPLHPEANYNLGLVHWRQGQITDLQLLGKLHQARAGCEDPAQVEYLLGLVHLEREDWETAIALLDDSDAPASRKVERAAALELAKHQAAQSTPLVRTFAAATRWATSAAFSQDGKQAVTTGPSEVCLWEVASGRCLTSFKGEPSGTSVAGATPDGFLQVLSIGDDRMLRLWSVASGDCYHRREGQGLSKRDAPSIGPDRVTALAWSRDGRLALSGSENRTLRLWDVSSGVWRVFRTWSPRRPGVPIAALVLFGLWVAYMFVGCQFPLPNTWVSLGLFFLPGPFIFLMVSVGLALQYAHQDRVTAVAFSPDGRLAVSGSADHTVRLWAVLGKTCLRTFRGHTAPVTAVTWSFDSRFILSASEDRTLRLWQIAGSTGRTFRGHTGKVLAAAFSPDGTLAASGDEDGTLRLWEIASGRCLRVFKAHQGSVTAVTFHPDGRMVLSVGNDQAVRLWRVPMASSERPPGRPWAPLAVSRPSSDLRRYPWLLEEVRQNLAAGNTARAAFLLRQARQEPGCSRRADALELAQQLARLLGHGRFLGGWERGILSQHHAGVNATAFSPDGRLVVSGSEDGDVRLGEVAGGRCLRTFEGHLHAVRSLAWDAHGCRLLSGSADGTMKLWEGSSGRSLRSFPVCPAYRGPESRVTVAWGPDGRLALSGSGQRKVQLWEVISGRCLRSFTTFSPHRSKYAPGNFAHHWNYGAGPVPILYQAIFWGAFCGIGGGVAFIHWLIGGPLWRSFFLAPVAGAVLLPLLFLVLRGAYRLIFCYSHAHSDCVTAVGFSSDGRLAFSCSADRTVRLWQVSSGRCLNTLLGHSEAVNAAAFSPDGRHVLSASGDETLRLWEVSSGLCLRSLEGHTGPVTAVAWSPDGRHALSGSLDRTIKLWEVSSGQCLRTFEGHTGPVHSVAWSPNGWLAVSGSADYTLRLWQLDWDLEGMGPLE